MDRKGRSPGWLSLNDGLPRGWALEGSGLGVQEFNRCSGRAPTYLRVRSAGLELLHNVLCEGVSGNIN